MAWFNQQKEIVDSLPFELRERVLSDGYADIAARLRQGIVFYPLIAILIWTFSTYSSGQNAMFSFVVASCVAGSAMRLALLPVRAKLWTVIAPKKWLLLIAVS